MEAELGRRAPRILLNGRWHIGQEEHLLEIQVKKKYLAWILTIVLVKNREHQWFVPYFSPEHTQKQGSLNNMILYSGLHSSSGPCYAQEPVCLRPGCTFLFHCLHITALWRTALDCASPLCETSLGCGIRTEDKAGPGQDYRKLPNTLQAPAGASSRTGLFRRLVSTVHSTGVFSLDQAKSDKD